MADRKSQVFDKVAYDRQFYKDHYTRVSVILNKVKDADIIEHLEEQTSKSDYIKTLIRNDMDR